jgi:ferric-dicitrate binding protein FerR (iron transport regulator)
MKNLLQKYFQGTISPEDKRKLFEELEQNPTLGERFVEMQHNLAREAMKPAPGDEAIANEGLVKLYKIKRRGEMRRKCLFFSRCAAAVLIVMAAGAWLVLRTPRSETIELAEVTAPAGERMELQLPDGTKVWLAPRSTLIRPVEFSGPERTVELAGEALFDVAHNAEKPFEVHSGGFTVRVLGTVFSTSSYGGEFETVLVEGAVEVSNNTGPGSGQTVTLRPGQRAWMEAGRLESEDIDTSATLGLQKGIYEFDNVPLGEITARLSVWHDVGIEFSDPGLASKRFCAKFRDGDDLETILKALGTTGGFDFSRDASGAISIHRK